MKKKTEKSIGLRQCTLIGHTKISSPIWRKSIMQLCSASSSSPNVFFCNIMERFFGETWKTIFYFGETCKWIFKDGELVKEHTWWNVKMKIIVSEWWIGKCIFFSKWWITHKNLSVRYTCPKIRHLVRKLHAPWKYTNFAPFLKKINWE